MQNEHIVPCSASESVIFRRKLHVNDSIGWWRTNLNLITFNAAKDCTSSASSVLQSNCRGLTWLLAGGRVTCQSPSLLHPAVHRSGQRDAHTGRGSECQEGRSVGSVVRSLAHSPALAGGECKERSFDSDVSSLLVAKNRMEMCMNYLHWSDIQILMTLTFRFPYSSSCLSYCPFGIVAVTHTNTLSLLLMELQWN